eukprot:ANDGO_02451.mRNA.1 hypothetical protein
MQGQAFDPMKMNAGGQAQLAPDFSSGLCSCCEDIGVCCCGLFCSGYLWCKHKARLEGRSEEQMTGCEKFGGCVLSVAALYYVTGIVLLCLECCKRPQFRQSLGIVPNDTCGEKTVAFCCAHLAICQQEREYRLKFPVQFANAAPPAQGRP